MIKGEKLIKSLNFGIPLMQCIELKSRRGESIAQNDGFPTNSFSLLRHIWVENFIS